MLTVPTLSLPTLHRLSTPLLRSALLATALAAASASAHSAALDTNLVVNGDAEAGSLAGWTGQGGDPVVVSASLAGSQNVPAGQSLGNWVFGAAAPSSAYGAANMTQDVDVSSLASLIDAQNAVFDYSVLLKASANAYAQQFIITMDGNGDRLIVYFVTRDNSGVSGAYDWTHASSLYAIPPGTRTIEILVALSSPNSGGTAYFDNASLSISAVPEPGTAALLLCGLVSLTPLGWLARKHRKAT